MLHSLGDESGPLPDVVECQETERRRFAGPMAGRAIAKHDRRDVLIERQGATVGGAPRVLGGRRSEGENEKEYPKPDLTPDGRPPETITRINRRRAGNTRSGHPEPARAADAAGNSADDYPNHGYRGLLSLKQLGVLNASTQCQASGRVQQQWAFPKGPEGQPHKPGELTWVHAIAVAANGDLYLGDVSTGRTAQKFARVEPDARVTSTSSR
jgi:hypothetical protein